MLALLNLQQIPTSMRVRCASPFAGPRPSRKRCILDEDGYLSIVDRIKDMIIRGGENIYPKEIEGVLAEHPAVLESAVIGAPHAMLGEVPVASVVLLPGAIVTESALIEHCKTRLAKIKVPVRIEFLRDLPRNPVGKVDKPRMRREATPVDVPLTATVALPGALSVSLPAASSGA